MSAGAQRRRTKSASSLGVTHKIQPISSEGVKSGPGMPWRTAARANRYRYTDGVVCNVMYLLLQVIPSYMYIITSKCNTKLPGNIISIPKETQKL